MLDFIRLGTESYEFERSGLRRWACWLSGQRGLGYAVKLWALQRLLGKLSTTPDEILDFGCSDGMYTRQLARAFPDAIIHGVDGDEQSITRASEVGTQQDASRRITFDLIHFDAFGGHRQYDLIVCLDVLHYSDRGAAYLEQVCRSVKPGGTLIVSSPRLKRYYRHAFDYYLGLVDVNLLDPLYTPEAIAKILKENGLAIADEEHYPSAAVAEVIEEQRARRWRIIAFYPLYVFYSWLGRRGTPRDATHFMYLARKPLTQEMRRSA